jgi:hypothetical protein
VLRHRVGDDAGTRAQLYDVIAQRQGTDQDIEIGIAVRA